MDNVIWVDRVKGTDILVGTTAFIEWMKDKKSFKYCMETEEKYAYISRYTSSGGYQYLAAKKKFDGVFRVEHIGGEQDVTVERLSAVYRKCFLPAKEYMRIEESKKYKRRVTEIKSDAEIIIDKLKKLVMRIDEMRILEEIVTLEAKNDFLCQLLKEKKDV